MLKNSSGFRGAVTMDRGLGARPNESLMFTVKQGNFRFFGLLQLFGLLCVCGACHIYFVDANRKRLDPRFSCCSFGPLPFESSNVQPVLKNCQSLFYMILKIMPYSSGSFEIFLFFNQ